MYQEVIAHGAPLAASGFTVAQCGHSRDGGVFNHRCFVDIASAQYGHALGCMFVSLLFTVVCQ